MYKNNRRKADVLPHPGTKILPFLHNQVDVPQGDILDFRLSGQQGNQWRSKLLQQHVVIIWILGEKLQELHQNFHCWQNHCWVGMGQPRSHPLTNTGDRRGFTFNPEISKYFRSYLNFGECTQLKTPSSNTSTWFCLQRTGRQPCFPEHSKKQRMTSFTASSFNPATLHSNSSSPQQWTFGYWLFLPCGILFKFCNLICHLQNNFNKTTTRKTP